MRLMKLSVFVLIASLSSNAMAEFDFNIDVGLRSDDNIGLGPNGDEKDDVTASVSGMVNWNFLQTARTELGVGAGLYFDKVSNRTDLSRTGIILSGKYRGQLTTELTSFFWMLDGEFKTLDYGDSDIRDGTDFEINATIGKRFNQWLTVLGGYRYYSRNSDDTDLIMQPPSWRATGVFDQDIDGGFLRGEFDVTPDAVVFAEYSYMSGDVTSTGTGANFNLGGLFDRAWDYAFPPTFIAWKIDADQSIYDLGVRYQFTEMLGGELAVSYLDADGEAGNDYDNTVVTLDVSFAF